MPPLRLLQVSDLHAGSRQEPDVEGALRKLVEEVEPELVVATGDLTHRGRPAQQEQAAALLRSLGPPVLAVPGNHDMPLLPPWRFSSTFAEFRRVWGETEPIYRSNHVVVCGLNSARPWKQQGGALRSAQLERARRIFADAPAGALRVVALHHHLLGAPWRTSKWAIARRSRVLDALVEAGVELIVSGHVHQSAVGERREFEVSVRPTSGTTVANAPGLGRPRAWRRGEARGLHVYEASDSTLRVLTYTWSQSGWGLVADRRFPRGLAPLDLT